MENVVDKIRNELWKMSELHKEIYIGYPEPLWRDAIKYKLVDSSFTVEMIDNAVKENNPIIQKYMWVIYYVDLPIEIWKHIL